MLHLLPKTFSRSFSISGVFVFLFLLSTNIVATNNTVIHIGDTSQYKFSDTPSTIVMKSGCVLVAGVRDSATGGTFGNTNMASVIKLDPKGNLLWAKSLFGPNIPYFGFWEYPGHINAVNAIETNSGNIAVVGYMYARYTLFNPKGPGLDSASASYVFLAILDPTGNLISAKTYRRYMLKDIYNSSLTVAGVKPIIKQTSDNGFIIGGILEDTIPCNPATPIYVGAEMPHAFLLKLDASCNTQWFNEYRTGTEDFDQINDVIQTTDGGYLAVGLDQNNAGSADYLAYALKTDGSGVMQWAKEYGGYSAEMFAQALETTSGYMFCGSTSSYGTGSWDAMLVQVDLNGNPVWTKTYGIPGGGTYDFASGFLKNADGSGFTVYASSSDAFASAPFNYPKPFVFKVDNGGGLIWSNMYDYGLSVVHEFFSGICERGQGCPYNLIFTSSISPSWGSAKVQYNVTKTDSVGRTGCEKSQPLLITSPSIGVVPVVLTTLVGGFSMDVSPILVRISPTTYVHCTMPLAVVPVSTDNVCTGQSKGTAAVTASGGFCPYTYSWTTGSIAASTGNLKNGGYTVTVTDAEGTTLTQTFTITSPLTFTLTATTANAKCSQANGSASISVTGGTTPYTYLWSNGTTGQTDNTLLPNTYTVTITDAASCSTSQAVVVKDTLAPAISNIAGTNILCKGLTSGSAVVTATGVAPLTYSWSTSATGQTINALSAATYTVSVTDANACVTTGTVAITEPASALTMNPPTFSDPSCSSSNGSIIATATGGTGVLTYSWSNGPTGPTNSNLAPGIYTLTVTDANACTTTKAVSLSSSPGPTINSIVPTAILCKGASTGSAAATATGSGTLTYSWSTGATGQTITNKLAGTYTVTVTDGGGCLNIGSITITEPASALSIASINASTTGCATNNGVAVASVSGGTGALTYSWSTGASTVTINNLASNVYTVTVTDANGCNTTKTQAVVASAQIIFAAPAITDASCGLSNGSAIVNASGGAGALTYNWSNSATGATANNLASGSYTVAVTDANGCVKTSSLIVNSIGAQTLVSTVTNENCKGGSTASAQINITGGTGPYTYTWNNGQNGTTSTTQVTGTNFSATDYTVTVTDANNCTAIKSITVTEPAAITFKSPNVNSATCGKSNGNITLSAVGGTGTLTYSWSNGAIGITNTTLAAGNYILSVTDANGCTVTESVGVNNNPGPTIDSFTSADVTCNGTATGSVSVSAAGGTGALTYSWSTGSTSATINNQIAGTYTVTVTDMSGCKSVSTTQVTEPNAISATIFSSAASCGSSNGSALVTSTSGGTSPFVYTWSTGSTIVSINNLSAGTYSLSITDANGCTKITVVAISNDPGPTITAVTQASPLCNGLTTGSVSITATGTGTLTYSWSNGATTATDSPINSGTYNVTVTDGNSCKTVSTVIITEPGAIVPGSISVTNTACTSSTGVLTLNTTTGGTGAYTYSWSSGASTSVVSGLSANTYTLTITDANGCSKTEAASVATAGGPTAITAVSALVKCNGGTGSVVVMGTGGSTPYAYAWSNGGTQSSMSNLPSAIYTVTITDANGCTVTDTITLRQPVVLTATVDSKPTSCGGINGAASAIPGGGTSGYTYAWSNGATSQTISNLPESTTYTVTVTDANACSSTSTTVITTVGTGTINITPATQAIVEGNSVAITVSGGTIYTWTPANSLTCSSCSNPVASPTSSTTYTITTLDPNGCAIEGQLTITVKPACVGDDQDVFIPNIFSPNGDGKNDVLYIGGNGLTNIYWAIYDRWGNLIFEAFDQSHGWDGTFNGNVMETGTYVYYLKATCVKTNAEVKMKGNVSIVK